MLTVTKMPAGVAALPRNKVGYPIPWFVAMLDGGVRDFRIVDNQKVVDAVRFRLCWICGKPRGRYGTFTIGSMCAVNRLSAEPPSHWDCAEYAARVCPFLANPHMRRREGGYPVNYVEPPGIMSLRNPLITVLWSSRAWRSFMVSDGLLFDIGENAGIQWFTWGRPATRHEVIAAMNIGVAELREMAGKEGPIAVNDLDERAARAAELFPA